MQKVDSEFLADLAELSERLAADKLYEITISEVQNEQYDPAAKARAIVEADGDMERAKALYIKHRVRRLNDLLEQSKAEKKIQELAEAENKARRLTEQKRITEARMSKFERGLYRLGKKVSKK